MKEQHKNKIFALIVIGLLVGILALLHHEPEEKGLMKMDSLMAVTVVSPEERTLENSVSLTGSVVPREDVVITSELSSVLVKDVLKDEGMTVEQGDVLAVLDSAALKIQRDEMEAKYKEAQTSYNRVKRVANTGAISPDSVDQKKADYMTAKAQFENAQLNVERTQVKTPANGLIYERQARIGAMVNGTDPLFRLAKNGEIEMEAMVSEDDLPRLQDAQTAYVTLTGGDRPIETTIRLIAPYLDANTRTAKVRITLPKEAGIAIGVFATAAIPVEKRTGPSLPQRAVQSDGKNAFVWIVDEKNKVHKVPVTVEMRTASHVLLASGALPSAARVVAKAGAFLNEGDEVVVVEKDKTDAKAEESK